jgi:hypothetical protein
MRTVRFAATFGAAVGIGIAAILLPLSENPIILIVMLSLCPSFYLGSTLYIKSKVLLYVVTIIGNGISYGALGAFLGAAFVLLQRLIARSRNK